jgi:hypothetical protein
MHEPYLQIMSDEADKAACPTLVEVPDALVVTFHTTNHATQCSTDVFEYHQKVFKLECMFFMWV